ncbi:MAG: ATP-binding protein [Chamaesiphon sp. CSU_1_12]|nr:ATP-binding protein [Chamaesiphon sp. CSU_1_12]
MAIDRPTEDVREEVLSLLEKLLNYDRQIDLSQSIQIETKWHENNLKIKATIDLLVLLLPEIDPDRSPTQQKDHLGYLLTEILDKQLQILIDERAKNRHGNYQGIREWKFTLKFWHPPAETDYIDLNLQALERHWNKTYQIKITPIAPAPLNNLPQLRHTEFIGHGKELDSLLELLATERQQTIEIVGMAGVGKTTLALEAADRCLTERKFAAIIFSSAQSGRFIGTHLAPNFIAEQNLRDLLQVIFRTLERLDDLPTDLTEQMRCIRSILTEQPTLLVVDNIENLIDRSDTIAFLGCLPPTVKVIITSRVRLGIGQVIDLHPLPARDSIDLIKHQAKTQNLQIDAIKLAPIHQLTGGLPLAITYLVGAIATSGFTILEASPQSPLTTGDFAQYCFAQSVAQLKAIPNSSAYQLLLSLSLFPDGAATAALAYITETSTISQDLQQLYQRSLAYPLATERYYLHSLTQEYAQLELDRQPELAAKLRTRWQNWYRDLAAPYGALDWQDWQDYSPLIAEWKNLRMAVDWCIGRGQYLEVLQFWHCLKGVTLLSGYWIERQRWLGWLQEQAQQQQDLPTIAELKYQHSFTLAFIDRSDSKGEAMELALATWEIRQDLEIDRQFELALYIAALYIRKLPQLDTQAANAELATVWIDRGLEILTTLPADRSLYHRHYFQVYYYQAEIQFVTGQLDSAYNLYLQAHQFAQKAGWQRFIHYTSGWIAIILHKQGQFIEAERRLSKVLKQMDKYHDVRAATLCRKHLAEVNRSIGNTAAAKKFAKQAKSGFKRLGMTAEFKAMAEFLQALNIRPSNDK